MTIFDDQARLPDDFRGEVRLFPLPDAVLFPHGVQPLHIFEARYRALVEDALTTDQLIALACLRPGWERDYEGTPKIADTVCIGRIVAHTRLDDGKFNLLLFGLKRGRIRQELPLFRSYRRALVEVLEDDATAVDTDEGRRLQTALMEAFRRLIPGKLASEQWDQLFTRDIPLSVLTDLAAFTLRLESDFKQQLLAECRVNERARQLIERLQRTPPDAPRLRFPPNFSVN